MVQGKQEMGMCNTGQAERTGSPEDCAGGVGAEGKSSRCGSQSWQRQGQDHATSGAT